MFCLGSLISQACNISRTVGSETKMKGKHLRGSNQIDKDKGLNLHLTRGCMSLVMSITLQWRQFWAFIWSFRSPFSSGTYLQENKQKREQVIYSCNKDRCKFSQSNSCTLCYLPPGLVNNSILKLCKQDVDINITINVRYDVKISYSYTRAGQ